MTNHYRTLGVDAGAEAVVIRSAYLALIRRYHPDRGGEDADPARAQAITAAWEVLRDPERRAAYDRGRTARLQPGGAVAAGLSGLPLGPKVRGGTFGRNLVVLLAAGTIGLGWWASTQPVAAPPAAPVVAARKPAAPLAAPAISPPVDEEVLAKAEAELAAMSPPPPVPDEAEEIPVVLPPLPAAKPLPVRMAERRPAAQPRFRPVAAPAAVSAPQQSTADPQDLAPLERHLQLLTDQSLRYGNAAEQARLFATREAFLKKLAACEDDGCRRTAYLRRNQEVAEIMRD
jgi:hypothetical protein